jgi:hypothetical protein
VIMLELVIAIAAMKHASISTLRFIPALTVSGQLGQSRDLQSCSCPSSAVQALHSHRRLNTILSSSEHRPAFCSCRSSRPHRDWLSDSNPVCD